MEDSDDPAIQYTHVTPNDAITGLQKGIDAGTIKLDFNSKNGYLQAVLRQLKVPASSQVLVFSKTSFQRQFIDPQSPRALYYNEGVYVGWVRGAPLLEIATIDPQLGAVFYVLNQEPAARPHFVRQTYECLQCHTGSMTQGVPGTMMRSVFARADGQPDFKAGTMVTTDQSPLDERWGGWYVTGTHGRMRHMGNVIARGGDGEPTLDREKGANVIDLRPFVDTTPYINRHSDIVSLMVMEHQTSVENLITKANYHTRMALRYQEMLDKELKRPAGGPSDSTLSRVRSVCEPLLRAMLFCDEAPLTSPVAGTSGFTGQFEAAGVKDHLGRSLRDFDLKTRLMRYPCSYLIYSDAFNGLPPLAKKVFYARLWDVLEGKDQTPPFARLTDSDRKAIREILLDTKPEFAAARPAN
ncbi:MAG TPA: hypothetical protein VKT77_23650 [Chthonomonadaceae bacterium]|nr:hypothetical protein [Chthonomonadaceae bacterium]